MDFSITYNLDSMGNTAVTMDYNWRDWPVSMLVRLDYNREKMEDSLAMRAHMMVLQVCNLDLLANKIMYFVTLLKDCILYYCRILWSGKKLIREHVVYSLRNICRIVY